MPVTKRQLGPIGILGPSYPIHVPALLSRPARNIRAVGGLDSGGGAMKRIFGPIAFVLFAIYFAVDAAFSCATKPLVAWIGRLRPVSSIRAWIVSLNAYSALALFAVPVVVLEPVKPAAAYLMATGHLAFGLGSLFGAEILKLTVVERLFELNRDKLLSIRAFAWGYGCWRHVMDWVESSVVWHAMRLLRTRIVQNLRGLVRQGKALPKAQRISHGNHTRNVAALQPARILLRSDRRP